MHISRLIPDVLTHLRSDITEIAGKHEGFPFHIVIEKYFEGKTYKVMWCRDPHGFHAYAQVDVKVGDVSDGRVQCSMHPKRKKTHDGERVQKSVFESGHNWYRQDWRFEPFSGPLDARMLWMMLETTCDWTGFYENVVEEVLGS